MSNVSKKSSVKVVAGMVVTGVVRQIRLNADKTVRRSVMVEMFDESGNAVGTRWGRVKVEEMPSLARREEGIRDKIINAAVEGEPLKDLEGNVVQLRVISVSDGARPDIELSGKAALLEAQKAHYAQRDADRAARQQAELSAIAELNAGLGEKLLDGVVTKVENTYLLVQVHPDVRPLMLYGGNDGSEQLDRKERPNDFVVGDHVQVVLCQAITGSGRDTKGKVSEKKAVEVARKRAEMEAGWARDEKAANLLDSLKVGQQFAGRVEKDLGKGNGLIVRLDGCLDVELPEQNLLGAVQVEKVLEKGQPAVKVWECKARASFASKGHPVFVEVESVDVDNVTVVVKHVKKGK